jgi:hypothetical protein
LEIEGESGQAPVDPDRTTEQPALPEILTPLERLAHLWNNGFLTDAEYEALKAKLIGPCPGP